MGTRGGAALSVGEDVRREVEPGHGGGAGDGAEFAPFERSGGAVEEALPGFGGGVGFGDAEVAEGGLILFPAAFEGGEGEGGGTLGGVGEDGDAEGTRFVEDEIAGAVGIGFGSDEGGEEGPVAFLDGEVTPALEVGGEGGGSAVVFHGEADGGHEDGAGLHAGAAGEGHGTDGEIDFADGGVLEDAAGAFDVLDEEVVGVAVKEEGGLGGEGGGGFGGTDDEGGFAAFGAGDEEVAVTEAEVFELAFAEGGAVLEAFDGANEGGIAAGHEAEDGGVGEESGAGEDFEGDGESAGGAAAAEEEPAPAIDGAGDGGGERREGVEFGGEEGEGEVIDLFEDGDGGGEVVVGEVGEVGGERVGLLGIEDAELELVGEGEEIRIGHLCQDSGGRGGGNAESVREEGTLNVERGLSNVQGRDPAPHFALGQGAGRLVPVILLVEFLHSLLVIATFLLLPFEIFAALFLLPLVILSRLLLALLKILASAMEGLAVGGEDGTVVAVIAAADPTTVNGATAGGVATDVRLAPADRNFQSGLSPRRGGQQAGDHHGTRRY